MGQSNAAVKQWLSKRERFADLFNGVIFDGKQVILACENQERVHYAMPVRTMLYDSLAYTEQIKNQWESLEKEDKKDVNREEFLSKFRNTDKIYPVITIVLYYGKEEWDGHLELYDMFEDEFKDNADKLINYIPNYRINLIDVAHTENVEKFQTDLQVVLGMLKYRGQKKELLNYLNTKSEYFRHVDRDTYYAIRAFLNSERILKENVKMKKGETDMCKALQDLYDEGVEKGVGTEREKMLNNMEAMLKAGEVTIEVIKQYFDFNQDELKRLQTL